MVKLIFADFLAQTTTTAPSSSGDGLIYVIAAYGAIWLLIFGYIYYIQRKQAALKRDIEQLREEEQAESHTNAHNSHSTSAEEAAFKGSSQQERG